MNHPINIDNYQFKGIKHVVENRSKDQTYLILSIQKCETYRLYQPFNIKVNDNPTTGYSWKVKTTSGLRILKDSYSNNCEDGIVGCGGIRTYTMEGTKRGEQILTAINGRSWDPSTNVEHKYIFNIV